MSHAAAARSAWSMALKGGRGMHLLAAGQGIGPAAAAAAAAVGRQAWLLPGRQLQWAGLTSSSSRSAAAAAAAAPSSSSSSGGSSSSGSGVKPKAVAERIGFIGAGQMGEALIRGFIKARVSTPGKICCSVRDFDRQDALERIGIGSIYGDATEGGSEEVARFARIIVLCTKPQAMPEVLESLAPHITPDHLVVSVAAGITLATLERALGEGARVVRVMPNTPSLVQSGASAFCLGQCATQQDGELVETLLSSVGFCIQVQEKQMDAVTGLSGSGPAFVFLTIEALADGGVRAGLPRDTALQLAAQTVLGSAKMVLDTGKHPGVLKDMVTSPAGTTIAGVHELEKAGTRAAFINAVYAATQRADELAKMD